MNEESIAYKLVWIQRGTEFWSYMDNTSYSIRYRISVWAKPIIGKLFVFKSREIIRIPTKSYGAIFKCLVKNMKPTQNSKYYSCVIDDRIRDFWEDGGKTKEGTKEQVSYFPTGTMLVDQIKLLERVE